MNNADNSTHWEAFTLRDPTTTIEHRSFNEALGKLRRILATADDTWLAQLVASTGGGKTHTATVLHGEILAQHAEEMKSDISFMPSVYISMSLLSDGVRHNWSDDHWKILEALKHPNPRSSDLSAAREKLKTTLKARRTKVLILDEAAHFISGLDPNDVPTIKRRANVVKSLTEDTQTRLLLCATYDLLPMIRVNGQLARRNQLVHLQRYRNTEVDRAAFFDVLANIEAAYPDHLDVSLRKMDEIMYRGCVGLIGKLRNWLVRASTHAELDCRKSITEKDLDATKTPLGELIPIMEDARNGEEDLSETDSDRATFEGLLEGDRIADRDRPPPTTSAPSAPFKPKNKGGRGRPNPTRICTGAIEDDPPK